MSITDEEISKTKVTTNHKQRKRQNANRMGNVSYRQTVNINAFSLQFPFRKVFTPLQVSRLRKRIFFFSSVFFLL